MLSAFVPQVLHRRASTITSQSLPNKEPDSIINALPIEVLSKIFVCCLTESVSYIAPAADEAPLLLCRVCRLWRITAQSTPELWCSIRVTPRLSPKLIDTWLSRAKAHPMSISFPLGSGPMRADLPLVTKRTHKYFDTLIPLSHHWQSVEITILPKAPLDLLHQPLQEAELSLESLILRFPFGTRMYSESSLDHIQLCYPRLRKVFIFGDNSAFSMSMLWRLPTSHLKTLCTDSLLYPEECVSLLRRLHKVEQGFFRLANLTPEAPLLMPSKPIVLKEMQTLSLQTFTSVATLFTHLILPTLNFLRLDFGTADEWSHEAFLSFISPFACSLTTLHLNGPPISEDKLVKYLELLLSLTELSLSDRANVGIISNQLMDSLTCREDGIDVLSQCPCPNLTTLELSGVHVCTDESIVAMLESRWTQRAATYQKIHNELVSLGDIYHYGSSSNRATDAWVANPATDFTSTSEDFPASSQSWGVCLFEIAADIHERRRAPGILSGPP
jgi:hypothetical protein